MESQASAWQIGFGGHPLRCGLPSAPARKMELEEQIKPVPRLEIAQWRFELLNASNLERVDLEATKQKMLDVIKEESKSHLVLPCGL